MRQGDVFNSLKHTPFHPVQATFEIKQSGDSLVWSVPLVKAHWIWDARARGVPIVQHALLLRDLLPQLYDFFLHLRIARSLAHSLEVVLDPAVKAKSLASRALGEGFLHDIAAQLDRYVSARESVNSSHAR